MQCKLGLSLRLFTFVCFLSFALVILAQERDPFRSPFIGKTAPSLPSLSTEPGKEQKEVSRLNLSALKLVGIITGKEGNIALLQDSEGKALTLREGSALYENARVDSVLADRIIIEEKYKKEVKDKKGRTRHKTEKEKLELLLRPEQEEGGN
jgi:Tfp pilus assembly protein PilP